jgi:hypothetical protein
VVSVEITERFSKNLVAGEPPPHKPKYAGAPATRDATLHLHLQAPEGFTTDDPIEIVVSHIAQPKVAKSIALGT